MVYIHAKKNAYLMLPAMHSGLNKINIQSEHTQALRNLIFFLIYCITVCILLLLFLRWSLACVAFIMMLSSFYGLLCRVPQA